MLSSSVLPCQGTNCYELQFRKSSRKGEVFFSRFLETLNENKNTVRILGDPATAEQKLFSMPFHINGSLNADYVQNKEIWTAVRPPHI
jgi:hypothetical protein